MNSGLPNRTGCCHSSSQIGTGFISLPFFDGTRITSDLPNSNRTLADYAANRSALRLLPCQYPHQSRCVLVWAHFFTMSMKIVPFG